MLKLETLEVKIEDYIVDLILNSNPETDWDNSFYKDNITISCESNKKFDVRFKNSSNWTKYNFKIDPFVFTIFNSKKRKKNKELRLKHKQIKYFIDNKTQLIKLKEIVDDFPIRVQRKEKLEKLSKKSS